MPRVVFVLFVSFVACTATAYGETSAVVDYRALDLKCDSDCCRASVRRMGEVGALLKEGDRPCPTGYAPETYRCKGSYAWCEPRRTSEVSKSPAPPSGHQEDPFFDALNNAAMERPKVTVRYDGRYMSIPYPMGDVPADTGVCTDEIIRVYRRVGVDLQELVHEDMKRSFSEYPKLWGLTRPNASIDHRRVPNLMHYFRRNGAEIPVSDDPDDYRPGSLVVWRLSSGLLHIGIVVDQRSPDGKRPMIVHNIAAGPKLEDAFDVGTIVAHFRFKPVSRSGRIATSPERIMVIAKPRREPAKE